MIIAEVCNTLAAQVYAPVQHLIPGTCGLRIHLTDLVERGKITPEVLKLTEGEVFTFEILESIEIEEEQSHDVFIYDLIILEEICRGKLDASNEH